MDFNVSVVPSFLEDCRLLGAIGELVPWNPLLPGPRRLVVDRIALPKSNAPTAKGSPRRQTVDSNVSEAVVSGIRRGDLERRGGSDCAAEFLHLRGRIKIRQADASLAAAF